MSKSTSCTGDADEGKATRRCNSTADWAQVQSVSVQFGSVLNSYGFILDLKNDRIRSLCRCCTENYSCKIVVLFWSNIIRHLNQSRLGKEKWTDGVSTQICCPFFLAQTRMFPYTKQCPINLSFDEFRKARNWTTGLVCSVFCTCFPLFKTSHFL